MTTDDANLMLHALGFRPLDARANPPILNALIRAYRNFDHCTVQHREWETLVLQGYAKISRESDFGITYTVTRDGCKALRKHLTTPTPEVP